MFAVASCTITVDDVRAAWRRWKKDPTAEVPERLVDHVVDRAAWLEAAMSDAALGLILTLLVDAAEQP